MITRIIRDEGAMNAVISSEEISKDEMFNRLKSTPNMAGLDLAKVYLVSSLMYLNLSKNLIIKLQLLIMG